MQAYTVYQWASRPATRHTPRQLARAAGILYLVTHVTSVAAVAAYGAGLIPAGVTLEFALAVGCAGTGVLLWHLLSADGRVRAATFALLRTVEASVIIAGTLPMLAMMWTPTMSGPLSAAATAMHTASFLVGQGLVISVNTIVLGWLLWDSRVVPRPLAALGVGGGLVVLASNLCQLWGLIPLGGPAAGAAAIPVFAFELWLAIRLIARGLRTPNEAADEAANAAELRR
ncbi:DUF4386 domain-containing protein [Cnuibacter physcomitrellae]|uniref:DUF4386 domain-containing protein n=1 Tax=Cnuibacter physcomitrellae TaxID=1619308 RepID=UPI002175D5D6|nr:DUF4386 domain-containing protein [Cnuibacter physcomitrellae]MCS5497398.1 DUF4386 domain-containing protein [Cnuibacter physcomitrellae]